MVAKNTLQFTLQDIIPENSELTVQWNSSDQSIASINEYGLLSSYKPGEVVISAESTNYIQRECLIHVCYPVTAIDFSQPVYYCNLNDDIQLQANVTMRSQNCTNHLVTFTRSDESIATVDENGIVRGISHGTVTITATAESGVSATTEVQVHNIVIDPAVAPTQTQTGLAEGSHCSVCGKILIEQEIVPADPNANAEETGHDNPMVHIDSVAATCTTEGNIEYWHCTKCGKYFSDAAAEHEIALTDTAIAATGHTVVIDPAVAPTETETGLTEGSHCSVCGEVIVGQKVVPVLEKTEIVNGGICGENLTWSLDNKGKMIISGTGSMFDYYDRPDWWDVRQEIIELDVAEGITSIGALAFSYCENLKIINLPDSLQSIGAMSFYNCHSILSVVIPESISSLNDAFEVSYDIISQKYVSRSFSLPSHIVSITNNTFTTYDKLLVNKDTITAKALGKAGFKFWIPGEQYSLRYLYNGTELDGLELVNAPDKEYFIIPNGITRIGKHAFWYHYALRQVHIPDTVKSIGEEAFLDCLHLQRLFIPSSVLDIEKDAFHGCVEISSISIPGEVRIGYQAFSSIHSLLKVEIRGELYNSGYLFDNDYGWTHDFVTIYCKEYSEIDLWALRNGYKCVYLDSIDQDSIQELLLENKSTIAVGTSITSLKHLD